MKETERKEGESCHGGENDESKVGERLNGGGRDSLDLEETAVPGEGREAERIS